MLIFPNPGSGQVSIRFYLEQPQEVSYVIYDITGRMCAYKRIGNLEGKQRIEVDVSTLRPGMYLFEIVLGNETITKKLVVQ